MRQELLLAVEGTDIVPQQTGVCLVLRARSVAASKRMM